MKFKALALALLTAIPGLIFAVTADCSEDVLFKFFPRGFVMEVFEAHNIPQDKANNIAEILYQSDQEVFQSIKSKAEGMDPNPLEEITAEKERAKLFRDSLTEVFTAAMEQNGIDDPKEIQTMLDEIQQMRMQRFLQCQKEGRLPKKPPEAVKN